MSWDWATGERAPGAWFRSALVASALGMSALVGGCSIPIAELPLAANPADTPPHPKDADGYLPVNELPAGREEAAMSPAERAKVQNELIAARERQAAAVAAKDPAAK